MREKEELLEINEGIVAQFKEMERRLGEVEGERDGWRGKWEQGEKEREQERKKHRKEVENMRLMHQQEVYMLKKKICSSNSGNVNSGNNGSGNISSNSNHYSKENER